MCRAVTNRLSSWASSIDFRPVFQRKKKHYLVNIRWCLVLYYHRCCFKPVVWLWPVLVPKLIKLYSWCCFTDTSSVCFTCAQVIIICLSVPSLLALTIIKDEFIFFSYSLLPLHWWDTIDFNGRDNQWEFVPQNNFLLHLIMDRIICSLIFSWRM